MKNLKQNFNVGDRIYFISTWKINTGIITNFTSYHESDFAIIKEDGVGDIQVKYYINLSGAFLKESDAKDELLRQLNVKISNLQKEYKSIGDEILDAATQVDNLKNEN